MRTSRLYAVTVMMTLAVLFLFQAGARAQAFDWDTEVAEKYVKGVTNIAASVISDSLTPMTHYRESEWKVSLVPSYLNVRRVFEEPDIEGKDLMGGSLSLGGGYAFTDRLMAYAIASYLLVDGDVEGTFYGAPYGVVRAQNRLDLFSFAIGAGYDLIAGEYWLSIPLFLGLNLQGYAIEMSMPSIPLPSSYTADISIDDARFLCSITAGAALSVQAFGCFRITPYFLYALSLNRPAATAEVAVSGMLSSTTEYDIESDRLNAFMFGLSLSTKATRRISVSASVGGIITSSTGFYNRTFLDGLNMISVVLAVTYSGMPGENVSAGQ